MFCVNKVQLALYSFSKVKYFSNRLSHLNSYAIVFKEYGDPNKVLEKTQCDVSDDLESSQVLIKILASSINPADINIIQGKYAIKPKLPAIAGGEAIGEVLKVGLGVKNLKVGDRVMPAIPASGTWKTHGVYKDSDLIEIDKDIPLQSAVTLSTNPCTAYRMLKDFVHLKEGDTVIQNGANSAVGQAAIQIAKHLKINTINVVRDRPNLESLKSYLADLGATHVVAENELRSPIMSDIFKQIPKPSLGFNCVGGKSAAELIRHMTNKGTLVTYGGMSKLPLTISTACLIFNDIRVVGYWMSRWVMEHSNEERSVMLKELTDIVKRGGLKPPTHREVDFDNFKDAVAKSMEEYVTEKQIIVMK
ncbi:enoyl-[acyl-carrier-protein] reductase, mitochondrial [Parasteatoda tepidariorum]|uniref:enoyl-[acyl-carrier-protein] reductase, mitochondrial n=1 Tax=Parasteatoda tepidariorum TaxID=114398 RepID=UPI001C721058|nr:enoyl-[acyl-carrier-protein] reductase, mitochondrial [Parasteatoda tepidariorum]